MVDNDMTNSPRRYGSCLLLVALVLLLMARGTDAVGTNPLTAITLRAIDAQTGKPLAVAVFPEAEHAPDFRLVCSNGVWRVMGNASPPLTFRVAAPGYMSHEIRITNAVAAVVVPLQRDRLQSDPSMKAYKALIQLRKAPDTLGSLLPVVESILSDNGLMAAEPTAGDEVDELLEKARIDLALEVAKTGAAEGTPIVADFFLGPAPERKDLGTEEQFLRAFLKLERKAMATGNARITGIERTDDCAKVTWRIARGPLDSVGFRTIFQRYRDGDDTIWLPTAHVLTDVE